MTIVSLRCLSYHLTPPDLVYQNSQLLLKYCGVVISGLSYSDTTNSLVRQSFPHSAAAAFASWTKGADCCLSAVVFRFVVGKMTFNVWQKAAARFRSFCFYWERPGIHDC